MKTNNISMHRSPLRKAIALAVTIAVVFWSHQANAYPLHNGEYAYWSELPESAQVLTDMKGKNNLDTAARQHAALLLLMALDNVNADVTGQTQWPERERNLFNAYFAALPEGDGNGHVAEVRAESLKLQADPSFVQPFVNRYFSGAALAEIQPMVANFEASAQRQINAAGAPIQTEAQKEAPKKIAQDAAQSGLTVAQFDYYLAAFMALCLIFIIIWLVWLFGACVPIRMTSDDPPQFKGRLNWLKVYTFTGRVRGSATRSDTSVSGSINTAGNRVQGSIRSKTTVTNTFRLVDPRNKQEQNFELKNWNIQLWEDQLVSVASAIRKNRNDGHVFVVVNHSTDESFVANTAVWDKFGFLDLLFVLGTIPIGMFFFPVWLLPIVWFILVKIQIKRFKSSGVQPLMEALNRKAEEFA